MRQRINRHQAPQGGGGYIPPQPPQQAQQPQAPVPPTTIVREAERFGEVLIQAKLARDSPADLRDFDAVGETNAKVISIGSDEHLGLVAKAAESHGMNDPVAVTLIDVARTPRSRALFGMKAAARSIGSCGNSLRKRHSVPSGTI